MFGGYSFSDVKKDLSVKSTTCAYLFETMEEVYEKVKSNELVPNLDEMDETFPFVSLGIYVVCYGGAIKHFICCWWRCLWKWWPDDWKNRCSIMILEIRHDAATRPY